MTTLIQFLTLYQLYVQLLKRKITFSEETSGASRFFIGEDARLRGERLFSSVIPEKIRPSVL